jgi:hypothetical protein
VFNTLGVQPDTVKRPRLVINRDGVLNVTVYGKNRDRWAAGNYVQRSFWEGRIDGRGGGELAT